MCVQCSGDMNVNVCLYCVFVNTFFPECQGTEVKLCVDYIINGYRFMFHVIMVYNRCHIFTTLSRYDLISNIQLYSD